MTVGSGISPDLLTPMSEGRRALAGSPHCMAYRRWGIAPRPEDVLHVVLTTLRIVRLSGVLGGMGVMWVGFCVGDGMWVLLTSGVWAGRGARGNDGGPEPSLRTSPSSSSSPAEGGFLQIPSGLSTPRAPRPAHTPDCAAGNFTGAGAGGLLGLFLASGLMGEELAGSPKPVAQATFFGVEVSCGR
jgi:hypothetical protein